MAGRPKIGIDFDAAAHIFKTRFLHDRMSAYACGPDNGLRFDFFRLFILLADCDTVRAAFLNRRADFKLNTLALKVLNGVIDKLRVKSRQNCRSGFDADDPDETFIYIIISA